MKNIEAKVLWSTPGLLRAVLGVMMTAAFLAGCAGSAPAPKSAAAAPETSGRQVTVQGELTDNGLGCKAVRASNGTLYNLARDIEGIEKGQRIWVEGVVVPNERCTVGVSVMPRRAGAVEGVASGLR